MRLRESIARIKSAVHAWIQGSIWRQRTVAVIGFVLYPAGLFWMQGPIRDGIEHRDCLKLVEALLVSIFAAYGFAAWRRYRPSLAISRHVRRGLLWAGWPLLILPILTSGSCNGSIGVLHDAPIWLISGISLLGLAMLIFCLMTSQENNPTPPRTVMRPAVAAGQDILVLPASQTEFDHLKKLNDLP